MKEKYLFIDFEYNDTTEKLLNLVSCAWGIHGDDKKFYKDSCWLHKIKHNHEVLKSDLEKLNQEGYIFVAWAVSAEASSLMSLHLDPLKFRWIDLFVEYRCLTNQHHALQYGKQLIQGKVTRTYPPKPKWAKTKDEKSSDPEHNLAAGCYKLLNVLIDTEHKTKMRDLIISSPKIFLPTDKKAILDYNESDIKYLPQLLVAVVTEYKKRLRKKFDLKELTEEMLYRGNFAARTAIQERLGYPINYEATKSFSDSVPSLLFDLQKDINDQFDEFKPFRLDTREGKFKWKQKETREWIGSNESEEVRSKWLLTPTGNYSLSLDAWKKFYDFRHSYPEQNFGAQIVRYLTTKQNLNGFLPPAKGKRNFWDSVGRDNRSRPYLNIYRSQSARNQPLATSFLFLKSAWMRALCEPPKGKMIISIDWRSQEFLLQGLLSGDTNQLDAYESGDVYLWFGKEAGGIPKSATKESHSGLRDKFKATTLGVGYGMREKALARKLTNDTGVKTEEHEALDLIELYEELFHVNYNWRQDILEEYYNTGYIKLDDGWYMWGDNNNSLSIQNMPVQGAGSVAMRRSLGYAQDVGLDIIFPLHDALYAEVDLGDWDAIDTLAKCMDAGFRYQFREFPEAIRSRANCLLDIVAWSRELADEKAITPEGREFTSKSIYIDDRAKEEYEKFSKYFDTNQKLNLF